MDINDCIRFANDNPVCHLATADGDQPRVRAMLFCFADDSGFYLQSGRMKDLYGQIRENPKIEICFYNQKENRMMRVTGTVEFVDDPKIRTRILDDRDFLKPWVKTADNPDFIVFRISRGSACFWTMETNLEPKEFILF